jgi:tripartite-type tricarboxylate transporter receptor subunit TctC
MPRYRGHAVLDTMELLNEPSFEKWGLDPQSFSSEQFTAFIKSEMAKWAKVVKEARIPPQ